MNPFETIVPSPRSLEGKLVVALVALHQMTPRSERGVDLSVRHLQEWLQRGSPSTSQRMIHRLVKDGFLCLESTSRGMIPNSFVLGPMAVSNLFKWQALGTRLLGPDGTMRELAGRPSIKYGYLGHSGCLVLGTVLRCGQVGQRDLERTLSPLIHPKTTRAALHRLIAAPWHILSVEHGTVSAASDAMTALDAYEHETGARQASDRLAEANAVDRHNYWVELRGGSEHLAWIGGLAKRPCFYCGAEATATSELDHYPPAHWGGSDESSLLIPSCRTCNRRLGQRLASTDPLSAPRLDEDIRIEIPTATDEEIFDFFRQIMFNDHADFVIAVINGESLDAQRNRVKEHFPIWVALLEGRSSAAWGGAGISCRLLEGEGATLSRRDPVAMDNAASTFSAIAPSWAR